MRARSNTRCKRTWEVHAGGFIHCSVLRFGENEVCHVLWRHPKEHDPSQYREQPLANASPAAYCLYPPPLPVCQGEWGIIPWRMAPYSHDANGCTPVLPVKGNPCNPDDTGRGIDFQSGKTRQVDVCPERVHPCLGTELGYDDIPATFCGSGEVLTEQMDLRMFHECVMRVPCHFGQQERPHA